MIDEAADGARRRHYGSFYGLTPAPESLAIVMGNCQAESLRITLEGDDLATVRIPAVHELTSDDLPHLERLLPRVSLLVTQPIRDGYHDLPLGGAEMIARLPRGARHAIVPTIRHTALYPAHVIVRDHSRPLADPPIVVYHDLRELARAAGTPVRVDTEAIRAIAARSSDELRRRESLHGAIPVSDLVDPPRFDTMRTINHPGNPVFSALAVRVRESVGLAPVAADPGRPLLDSVHAPRDLEVIETWGLDDAPTDHWVVDGEVIPRDTVLSAHREWYREHPETVSFAVRRHAETLRMMQS
ncbi:WcbI family polysaccharide biosynthesis putative acetyltransferase [Marisediminicola sp. LYQ134]|uniref:WcbI family polysaccharide biosynthesis putative acetyltransferase n=1 Tax=Marisediminicola sp. LYQ134 TaxID=3391061 RepID=UPI003982E7D9